MKSIGEQVQRQINKHKLATSVDFLALFILILDKSISPIKDEIKYRRANAEVRIKRNIDHSFWSLASEKEKYKAIFLCLREGVGAVPEQWLDKNDKAILVQAIEVAHTEWAAAH